MIHKYAEPSSVVSEASCARLGCVERNGSTVCVEGEGRKR
jgi:hypothetical protein